jgi:hypothetical protein
MARNVLVGCMRCLAPILLGCLVVLGATTAPPFADEYRT